MSDDLTPRQALLVWCLLAKQGAAWQGELLPKIEAKDRKALEARKFVATRKVKGHGNALWLEVQDSGWAWAAAHLDAGLPPAYRVLQDLLARLQALVASGTATLAELIGSGPTEPPPPPSSVRQAPRAAIENAYLAVTHNRKGIDVRLSDVRARLALPRDVVDAALAAIQRGDPKARLLRIDDQHAITSADRDAAFLFAGEPFHILWIMP